LDIKNLNLIAAAKVNVGVVKGVIVLTFKDFKKSYIIKKENGDYKKFLLSKIEIHLPCLHSIDGKLNAVEVNLIFKSALVPSKVKLAILSSLFKFSKDGGLSLWDDLALALKGNKKLLNLNLGDLCNSNQLSGFHYEGTLTSPPCESAEWFISQVFGKITIKQFNLLTALLKVKV
jgi:carbonic anhydrase